MITPQQIDIVKGLAKKVLAKYCLDIALLNRKKKKIDDVSSEHPNAMSLIWEQLTMYEKSDVSVKVLQLPKEDKKAIFDFIGKWMGDHNI